MNPLVIDSLFPDCVKTVCGPIERHGRFEYPEEEAVVARAIERRRFEFLTGRSYARRALGELGYGAPAILRAEDGRPQWPDEVVGSISHCPSYCAAAATHKKYVLGLGLDLDQPSRFNPEIAQKVLTDEERGWIGKNSDRETSTWLAFVFSAKESLFKCLYPVAQTWFGFQDAVVEPMTDPDRFKMTIASELERKIGVNGRLEGCCRFGADWVATGVVLWPDR